MRQKMPSRSFHQRTPVQWRMLQGISMTENKKLEEIYNKTEPCTKHGRDCIEFGLDIIKKAQLNQLDELFIVNLPEKPAKKDCCEICGQKPTRIIHAECAMGRRIISTIIAKKLEEAEQKGRQEIIDALPPCYSSCSRTGDYENFEPCPCREPCKHGYGELPKEDWCLPCIIREKFSAKPKAEQNGVK